VSGEVNRKKREAYVCCLSCGQTSAQFVMERPDDAGLKPTAPCPKCSNTAYTQNLVGLWAFMSAAAQEIAQLKLDLLDVQGSWEEKR